MSNATQAFATRVAVQAFAAGKQQYTVLQQQYNERVTAVRVDMEMLSGQLDIVKQQLSASQTECSHQAQVIQQLQSQLEKLQDRVAAAELERDQALGAKTCEEAAQKSLQKKLEVLELKADKERAKEDQLLSAIKLMRKCILESGILLPEDINVGDLLVDEVVGPATAAKTAASGGMFATPAPGANDHDLLESMRISGHSAEFFKKRFQTSMLQMSSLVLKEVNVAKENEELKTRVEELQVS